MKRRAFTLIELLVVVAIIAALIAILVPSMNKAVDAAQRAVCLSNQKQIMAGGITLAAENQGTFAPLVTFGWEYQMMRPARTPGYDIGDYLDNVPSRDVFYCPSRDNTPNFGTAEQQWQWQTDLAPTYANWHIEHLVDYWLYFLSGHRSNGALLGGPYRLATTGAASSSITTITCWGEGRGISGSYAGNVYESIHGREGLPSAFLDGHAAWVDRSELVYDGRMGNNVQILRAVQPELIGQVGTPHSQSQPLDP